MESRVDKPAKAATLAGPRPEVRFTRYSAGRLNYPKAHAGRVLCDELKDSGLARGRAELVRPQALLFLE